MIMQALRWKLLDIEAAKELAERRKVKDNEYSNNILTRDWF